jgi:hypothetical protein
MGSTEKLDRDDVGAFPVPAILGRACAPIICNPHPFFASSHSGVHPMTSTAKRFTVHLPAHALDALGMDPDQALSGRITETALRYRALLDEAMPTLTEGQWRLICDALKGLDLVMDRIDMDRVQSTPQHLDRPGLGEKWNVDAQALQRWMMNSPYVQQVAICDVVRNFWHLSRLHGLPDADSLRQAGARLAD